MSANEFAFVFEGDGRKVVEPLDSWEMPGRPIPVRRAEARRMAEEFEKTGWSVHSEAGHTLWVMVAWGMYRGEGLVIKFNGTDYLVSKPH